MAGHMKGRAREVEERGGAPAATSAGAPDMYTAVCVVNERLLKCRSLSAPGLGRPGLPQPLPHSGSEQKGLSSPCRRRKKQLSLK